MSLGMVSSAVMQLMRHTLENELMVHLGYPLYLQTMVGVWKLLGVIVVLAPRLPLAKEWAYAGFFFAMSGAFVSHVALGDPFSEIFPSVLLMILTVVSWYFRPESRRIRPVL